MNTKIEFSVLMSVYYKEKRENLKQCFESIYEKQTLKPNEIILIEDGQLTEELYEEIEIQKIKLKEILRTIKIEENSGLGNALKIGVLNCKYDWIARMDTDDIAYPERFLKQVTFLENNPQVDVLGSFMTEFSGEISNKICVKDALLDRIEKFIKYRSPINHPSAFLRKSKVLEAGNYEEKFIIEDYYLWIRMFSIGAKFTNIPEELIYFRVDDNTFKRRGGWKDVKAEWILQEKCLELGITNRIEFWENIILKTIVKMSPNFIRKFIYLNFLRKSESKK